MASTTYAGHTYTQVDTTFNGDVAVKIDELSGRQGDNMRPVYLQLVQTSGGVTTPWNLSNRSVELGGKDYQGRVKLTNTATVTNAAKGMILLSVPGAFYQTVGDYQSAYLRIMQGSTVVSTINVAFTVYQDGLAMTTGDSVTYIGQISQLIAQANALVDPLNTKIKSASSAADAVSTAVKAYQNEVASTGVAKAPTIRLPARRRLTRSTPVPLVAMHGAKFKRWSIASLVILVTRPKALSTSTVPAVI